MVQISLRIVQVDGKKRAQGFLFPTCRRESLGAFRPEGVSSRFRVSLALPGGALFVSRGDSAPGGGQEPAPCASQRTASGGAPLSPPDMPEATA